MYSFHLYACIRFSLALFKILLFRQENNKTHVSKQDKCFSMAINTSVFFSLERFVPFCLDVCVSVFVCPTIHPTVRLSIRLPICLFVAPSTVFIRLLFTAHFYCIYELCAGLIRLEWNLSRSHIRFQFSSLRFLYLLFLYVLQR